MEPLLKKAKKITHYSNSYKKSIFDHINDQKQCNDIINAMTSLSLPLSKDLIIECAEFATGNIILCGGKKKCSGEILILASHNWNVTKIDEWHADNRMLIKHKLETAQQEIRSKKKNKHEIEEISRVERMIKEMEDEDPADIFDSINSNHSGKIFNKVLYWGAIAEFDPYHKKFCGIRKYNLFGCYIYRCSEEKCTRELNIFPCKFRECVNKFFVVEEGSMHGSEGDELRPPTGVCTTTATAINSTGKPKNCESTYCQQHWDISGSECGACGDWYCLECIKNEGQECFHQKCHRWFCLDHKEHVAVGYDDDDEVRKNITWCGGHLSEDK